LTLEQEYCKIGVQLNIMSIPQNKIVLQILDAWKTNNEINLLFIQSIPTKGFHLIPPDTKGRSVKEQLIHMHNVRYRWMEHNDPALVESIPKLTKEAKPTKAQILSAFKKSGLAAGKYIQKYLEEDKRIKYFDGSIIRWIFYLVSHESHHRGAIFLTLKLGGMPIPENISNEGAWGSWYSPEKK